MSIQNSTEEQHSAMKCRDDFTTLHRVLDDAAFVLKLDDAVCATAHALISRIPAGAPVPVSPASIKTLAQTRNRDPRTIHNHIKKLTKLDLIQNECLDGGRRHVARDQYGEITVIAGIDFSPLLDEADKWASDAEARRGTNKRSEELRRLISQRRRKIRCMINAEGVSEALRELWIGFPRRVAHLSLADLKKLLEKVTGLLAKLEKRPDFESDQSERNDRPYTTRQDIYKVYCNPTMSPEKEVGSEVTPVPPKGTCGLEHITLDMAMMAAPEDWHVAMEMYGRPSMTTFIEVAYEKAQALRISKSAWALAQDAIGQSGAAILVLIADADSVERGGKIRSPGGWMRRMAERAEAGTAHLNRSVFGLLHRQT